MMFSDKYGDKVIVLRFKWIKWTLNEEFTSYSDQALYYTKCKQVNILPISKRFDLNDLLFFHKIDFQHIYITIPPYIKRFSNTGRSR